MIFARSIPKRRYRNYTRYRELLREDFQYRCAYCLIHEYHNGSEANFAIDHHRPVRGIYGRPDLENEYTNLYWCCAECNLNKGDLWISPEEEALGFRWLDPCEVWGDHDLHWQISPNGEIEWLTPVGKYTVRGLMLDRRDWLKNHWRKLYGVEQKQRVRLKQRDELLALLINKQIEEALRIEIKYELRALSKEISELQNELEPPIFHKPRR